MPTILPDGTTHDDQGRIIAKPELEPRMVIIPGPGTDEAPPKGLVRPFVVSVEEAARIEAAVKAQQAQQDASTS